MSIVVDIDDTLVDTSKRTQAIWKLVLECSIPLNDIRILSPQEIFTKYASSYQMNQIDEYRSKYWKYILGIQDYPFKNHKLYKPIEFSVEVLRRWQENFNLIYITGRPDNTRDFTITQLSNFDFPIRNIELVMFPLEDFSQAQNGFNGPILIEIRKKLVTKLNEKHKIIKVVDDNPRYFPIYKQCMIHERIGLLRSKVFSQDDFIQYGATRVINNWKELLVGSFE